MKYPWLYVGAKVVWKGDGYRGKIKRRGPDLQFGQVYTVRDLFPWHQYVGVLLEEVRPNVFWHGQECGWEASNFCPLRDTTKQVEAMKRTLLSPGALAQFTFDEMAEWARREIGA